jgi:D-serine deaminase-like pyridoxal phosphate-dependent protein
LPFPPAAALLTRVVSRPSEHRLTLDAGSKALAPDPPLERRLYLPDLPDARFIRQNEEHLGVESPHANRYRPGDLLLGLPGHICPTCNLHERLLTVEEGRITGSWEVRARTRRLSFES